MTGRKKTFKLFDIAARLQKKIRRKDNKYTLKTYMKTIEAYEISKTRLRN